MANIWLVQSLAVEIDLLVHYPDAIAGDAHAALHQCEIEVRRRAEHDNISSLDLLVRQQMLGNRSPRCIGQLIDQQVVADHQRILH